MAEERMSFTTWNVTWLLITFMIHVSRPVSTMMKNSFDRISVKEEKSTFPFAMRKSIASPNRIGA